MNPIVLYKKRGETPLACLERYRSEHVEFAGEPMTYAGRLDPLAEGVLIVLVGEECKNKEQYTTLDKTYEFEVLLGFETDSSDILGLATEADTTSFVFEKEDIEHKVKPLCGVHEESYPPFSSKPVNGKPLFAWAKEGRLGEIVVPTHEVHIKRLSLLSMRILSNTALLEEIEKRIAEVSGDFRQEEIVSLWKKKLEGTSLRSFTVLRFSADVTSGTYIRSLAVRIGRTLGVSALAFSIKRIRIGTYTLPEAT